MTRTQLIQKALDAGLQVRQQGPHIVIRRTGRGAAEVVLYDDGTILRNDMRLDLARPMTVKDTAAHLKLK
jgi:hypothetical protein